MKMNDKFIKKTMIPFALVNNKVKGIENITKLDIPVCLECGEILILRNGEKNIKHLAHKSDSKCIYKEVFKQNSNQETYEHKFAKEFIKDNLTFFREYMNKIVVKDDNNNIELILCKNESDAVRFYNKIEEFTKKDKIKQVLFMGDFSSISERRRNLEKELIEYTGWSKKKIQMKNNTYYRK